MPTSRVLGPWPLRALWRVLPHARAKILHRCCRDFQRKLSSRLKTLDFGNVPMGARSQKAVNVTNPGSDKLSICVSIPSESVVDACTQIYELQPAEAPFALVFETFSETGKWSVEPAESREFIVSFSPVMEGGVSATIVLYNNSTNLPEATIQVLGNGVPPELELSGTSFDFGEVTVSKRKELASLLPIQPFSTNHSASTLLSKPLSSLDIVWASTIPRTTSH